MFNKSDVISYQDFLSASKKKELYACMKESEKIHPLFNKIASSLA
jgi:hypothetical protein